MNINILVWPAFSLRAAEAAAAISYDYLVILDLRMFPTYSDLYGRFGCTD